MRTRRRRIRHFLRVDLTLFRDFSRRITQLMYVLFHFLRSLIQNDLSSPVSCLYLRLSLLNTNHSLVIVHRTQQTSVSTNSSALFCKMFPDETKFKGGKDMLGRTSITRIFQKTKISFYFLLIIRNQ